MPIESVGRVAGAHPNLGDADDAGAIKTLLAPLSGSAADAIILDIALALARPLGSHIECCHCHVDAGEAAVFEPQVSYLLGPALRNAMQWLEQRGQLQAISALHHYEEFRALHALPDEVPMPCAGVSASLLMTRGNAADVLCRQARHHDLVVLGRPRVHNGLPGDLVQRLLLESGTPLLLVPEQHNGRLLETVMLCWKETTEAAHALAASLPLLRAAQRVVVASIDEGSESSTDSLQAVSRRLAWHGVHPELHSVDAQRRPTMEVLWASARDCRADLLVMGGYSRGPLRELLFGGCTESVLSGGELPVLVAH
jgi:nucleotide-binding universal stress UspA family protein